MTMPGRLPLPDPLFFWATQQGPVVFENEFYSTLVLFKSPADAEEWRAACVDGTPEDTELQGGRVDTVEELERLFGMLPHRVGYMAVNPNPYRSAEQNVTKLGDFLDYARDAARKYAR